MRMLGFHLYWSVIVYHLWSFCLFATWLRWIICLFCFLVPSNFFRLRIGFILLRFESHPAVIVSLFLSLDAFATVFDAFSSRFISIFTWFNSLSTHKALSVSLLDFMLMFVAIYSFIQFEYNLKHNSIRSDSCCLIVGFSLFTSDSVSFASPIALCASGIIVWFQTHCSRLEWRQKLN